MIMSASMSQERLRQFLAAVVVWAAMTAVNPTLADTASTAQVPAADRIQPAELAASLASPSAAQPLILHVGFRTMYDQAHIPGSQYAGPGNTPAGLKLLGDSVSALPKDAGILIYCGCCPWDHCPNVNAAYHKLRELGFTGVKVLYIARNFGTDWVDKGYPTIASQEARADTTP